MLKKNTPYILEVPAEVFRSELSLRLSFTLKYYRKNKNETKLFS